jgi:23S rRNA (adenine2503-C2)-methyltransferase
MTADPPSIYGLDRDRLAEAMGDQPSYRVDQLWAGLYGELRDVVDISPLPASLRDHLDQRFPPALALVTRQTADGGTTTKWLWRLADGHHIETVLMDYGDRSTVCVSTQVGCAMACDFCATGQAGFDRHLDTGEIVEQIIRAARAARPRRLSNVVFMGMGEPLANYQPTRASLLRCRDDLGLSARHLTVSTVGMVPGIDRLAQEGLPVTLAVSLHAANDQLRDQLVPINKRYPLPELMAACQRWIDITGRRISFEWAMIADVNDSATDAQELAELARPLRAHVNLIPLNATDGMPAAASTAASIEEFRSVLARSGVNVTVRANRGNDIDAACGQLRQRTSTVRPAPVRIASTSTSPSGTTPPGHTTDRST